MRPLLALFVTALTLATASASGQPVPASSYGEAVFVVSGRGYGHGVGMSQYGAYGQALAGRTYDQILGHYYTGTEIGKAGRKEVRVLLAEGRRAVTISSTAPYTAVDATGALFKLPKGALTLRSDLELPSEAGPASAVQPLVFRPGKAALLTLDGRAYRGKLELVPQGEFLRVVNVAALESYLQGVVAGEVPYSWPAEALKAQAVAARSYALANLVKGKPFDLYSDVRSQVYGGVAGERPSTTKAVAATAGQVVLYGGKVATTYYFSTSGGKTASAVDVFGINVPYLVSRPDPWDKASPYHRWGPVPARRANVAVEARRRRTRRRRVRDADAVGPPAIARRPDDERPGDRARVARENGARPALDVDHRRRAPTRQAVGGRRGIRIGGASGRRRSRSRYTAARVVTGRRGVVRRRRGHLRQDRRRHRGRQADADHAVPAGGGGRLVTCCARPGRAANPADQTDRARADDPARNRAAATRGRVRRRRAAQGLVVGHDRRSDASMRPARSCSELDAVVPSGCVSSSDLRDARLRAPERRPSSRSRHEASRARRRARRGVARFPRWGGRRRASRSGSPARPTCAA